VTGYQALGAGTPLLSYRAENTVWGMQFHHAAADAGGAADYPVLHARSVPEYVAHAGRLITDPAYRAAVGARGKAFFDAELGNAAAYSRRFFDTIAAITERTLAAGERRP